MLFLLDGGFTPPARPNSAGFGKVIAIPRRIYAVKVPPVAVQGRA